MGIDSITDSVRPVGLRWSLAAGWVHVRLALLGLLAVAPLGFGAGGYRPTAWGWSALALLWVSSLGLLLRRELRLGGPAASFAAAFACLLGWTLLSALWTTSATRTLLEAERTLVYLATALAAAILLSRRGWPALAGGVWAAIVLVSGYGLLTRLLPERFDIVNVTAGYRLAEPIGYWNGLGLLAAIGVLLAAGLLAHARSPVARAAAAASLPVLATALYLTFSRGALYALAAGLAVTVLLDPRRLRLVTALLITVPWAAFGVSVAARSDGFTESGRALPLEVVASEGRRILVTLLVLTGAGAATSALLTLAAARLAIGAGLRRAYAGALLALVVAGAVAVIALYGSPAQLAERAYEAFAGPPPAQGGNLNDRLRSFSGGGRDIQWRVAWEQAKDRPAVGTGAGTYAQFWLASRPSQTKVQDAHSLYLETLAELGVVGLALLVTALAVPLAAARRARREPLAVAALGAYVAYLVHAGIDWDWELPAVTVAALLCGAVLIGAAGREGPGRRLGSRARTAGAVAAAALGALALAGLVGNTALAEAEQAAREGDAAGVLAPAMRAKRWAPWSSEPWRLLGQAQLERGDLAGARRSYRRAVDLDPREWELWVGLASASTGRERRRAAARAAELNPQGR